MDAFEKAMDQAQQAAQQAAAQAKVAGGQVQQKMSDPATQAQAKVQMAKAGVEARRVAGKARRGVTTIIEKIDPALLADVVGIGAEPGDHLGRLASGPVLTCERGSGGRSLGGAGRLVGRNRQVGLGHEASLQG